MNSKIKNEIDQAIIENTPLTRYQSIWLTRYTAWKENSRTIYNPEKGGIKRGLQYICWDVCPQCGELCSLNGDAVCYECMIEQTRSDRRMIAAWNRKLDAIAAGKDDYEFDFIA